MTTVAGIISRPRRHLHRKDQSLFRRREILLGLVGLPALSPKAAAGQGPPVRIGFLHSQEPEVSTRRLDAFHAGLAEQGFVEGTNLEIDYRWANGDYTLMPRLAAELVERKVGVIVAIANNAVEAALAATNSIPIVAMMGGDLVAMGFVESLGRPGGNLTGVNVFVAGSSAEKRLSLLHELLPNASTIAVLLNPADDTYAIDRSSFEDAASRMGLALQVFAASTRSEIDAAFEAMAALGLKAMIMETDPSFEGIWRDQVAMLTRRHRIVTMDAGRASVETGGLMSYSVSLVDGYHQTGIYVGRVLHGEAPGSLPVLQSATYEFVINLKTAVWLGVEIPESLLAIADELIE